MMWRSLSVIQGLSSVDRDIEPGPDPGKLTARGSLTVHCWQSEIGRENTAH